MLGSIPLCTCTKVSLSLIGLETLGYFHELVTMRNTAISIDMHGSLQQGNFIFFEYIFGHGLLHHIVVLPLILWRTSILIPMTTTPMHTNSKSLQIFFSYPLSCHGLLSWIILSDFSYLSHVLSLWFWFLLPWWLVMLKRFLWTCWLSSLERSDIF